MEYKTIVVHLDAHPRRAARLEIAMRLAARTASHLVGLFAINAWPMPRYVEANWSGALTEATEQQYALLRTQTQQEFEQAAARYPDVRGEWREDGSGALGAVSLSARYADLAIIGQHDPNAEFDSRVGAQFAQDLVLLVSRPLLMVPYAGRFDTLGERVLLAWDGSPQAMRAATDALPLLARSKEVSVVVFDIEKHRHAHGEVPGADLSLFLARHGVNASVSQQRSIDGDVGAAILSRTADWGADLIVMGAYGHSRAKEHLLGGATRTLFDSMTVPVLMSH
ncbi:MAG: universal stress protein [Burkholderiales bacterium]